MQQLFAMQVRLEWEPEQQQQKQQQAQQHYILIDILLVLCCIDLTVLDNLPAFLLRPDCIDLTFLENRQALVDEQHLLVLPIQSVFRLPHRSME